MLSTSQFAKLPGAKAEVLEPKPLAAWPRLATNVEIERTLGNVEFLRSIEGVWGAMTWTRTLAPIDFGEGTGFHHLIVGFHQGRRVALIAPIVVVAVSRKRRP